MDDVLVWVLIVGLASVGAMTALMTRDRAGRDWLRRRWWLPAVSALGLMAGIADRLSM